MYPTLVIILVSFTKSFTEPRLTQLAAIRSTYATSPHVHAQLDGVPSSATVETTRASLGGLSVIEIFHKDSMRDAIQRSTSGELSHNDNV